MSPDVGQKADILGPKNKFYNLIHQEFGTDYRRFFEAGSLGRFANEAEMSAPKAINLLAEKILLESGRNEDSGNFKGLQELPHNKQVEFLAGSGLKIGDNELLGFCLKDYIYLLPAVRRNKGIRRISGKGFQESRNALVVPKGLWLSRLRQLNVSLLGMTTPMLPQKF